MAAYSPDLAVGRSRRGGPVRSRCSPSKFDRSAARVRRWQPSGSSFQSRCCRIEIASAMRLVARVGGVGALSPTRVPDHAMRTIGSARRMTGMRQLATSFPWGPARSDHAVGGPMRCVRTRWGVRPQSAIDSQRVAQSVLWHGGLSRRTGSGPVDRSLRFWSGCGCTRHRWGMGRTARMEFEEPLDAGNVPSPDQGEFCERGHRMRGGRA